MSRRAAGAADLLTGAVTGTVTGAVIDTVTVATRGVRCGERVAELLGGSRRAL